MPYKGTGNFPEFRVMALSGMPITSGFVTGRTRRWLMHRKFFCAHSNGARLYLSRGVEIIS
jgi:hypothetical protein